MRGSTRGAQSKQTADQKKGQDKLIVSRSGGSRTAARVVGWIFFIVYIAALVYFLFFAEGYGRVIDGAMHYNLEPFREIKRFLIHYDVLGWQAVVLNIIGNVVGFMPFGFFLPLLSAKERRLLMVLLLTFELSLTVEVIQLFTGVGSFDVDDLMLNTLGGVLGYGCYHLFSNLSKSFR